MLLLCTLLWRGGSTPTITAFLAMIACLCTLTESWRRHGQRENISLFLQWMILAFTFWTILAFLLSQTKNVGLDEVVQAAALGGLCLWAARAGRHPSTADLLLTTILAGTLASCGIGLLIYTLQPFNRFVGPFVDPRLPWGYWPNAWADYVLLAWPVCAAALHRKPWPTVLKTTIIGVVIGCLLLSYSRGAFLAFFAQGMLLFFLGRRRPRVRSIICVLMAAAVTFAAANSLRSLSFPVQPLGERLAFAVPQEGAASITERWELWQQAGALTWQKPATGFGPGSFRFVHPILQKQAYITADDPHSLYLKFAMERGWPAVLVFVLLVGFVLWRSCCQRQDSATLLPWQIHLLAVAITGVLLHQALGYNFAFLGIAVPFWLVLGLLAGVVAPGRDTYAGRAVECLLLMAALAITLHEVPPFIASGRGYRAEVAGSHSEALAWYERAQSGWFSRDVLLRRAHLLMAEGRPAEAGQVLDRFLDLNEQDARGWKYRGDLARQTGDGEAIRAYEEAFRRGRFNYLLLLHDLLETLTAEGKRDVILTRKAEFDSLLQAFATAITENRHFVALTPNVEYFIAIADQLAGLFPEDAPSYRMLMSVTGTSARHYREEHRYRAEGILW